MKGLKKIITALFLAAVLLSSCYNFSFFPSVTKYYRTLSLIDELEDFTYEEVCADDNGIMYLAKGSMLYRWSESSGLVHYLVFESPINAMDIDTETSQLYVLIDRLWEVDLTDGTKSLMDENCSDCSDLCVAGDYIVLGQGDEWSTNTCQAVRRSDYTVTDSFNLEDQPVRVSFSASDSRLFIKMPNQHGIVDMDQATGLFGTVFIVDTGDNIRAISPDGTKMVTRDGSIVSADENWDYLGSVNDGGYSYTYNLRTACFFNGCLIVYVNDSGGGSEQQGMTILSPEAPFDPVKPTMGIESTGLDLLVSGEYMYLLAIPDYDYNRTEIYRFDDTICDP